MKAYHLILCAVFIAGCVVDESKLISFDNTVQEQAADTLRFEYEGRDKVNAWSFDVKGELDYIQGSLAFGSVWLDDFSIAFVSSGDTIAKTPRFETGVNVQFWYDLDVKVPSGSALEIILFIRGPSEGPIKFFAIVPVK